MKHSGKRPQLRDPGDDGWHASEAVGPADVFEVAAGVNEQLLDRLTDSARGASVAFPLPQVIREAMAHLNAAERQRAARCGVLLTRIEDLALLEPSHDRPQAQLALAAVRDPWLTRDQAISLTHCALMAIWHISRVHPGMAALMLGVSAQQVAAYRQRRLWDLAQCAREHPEAIRPRWPERVDIWSNLIEGAHHPAKSHHQSVTLRCLLAMTASSERVAAHLQGST